MDLHRFTIEGKPVPASRPRVTTRGSFYPKAHTAYSNYLKAALPLPTETLDYPVEVRLLSVMPPFKGSLYPTSRCDVDNLAKLPLDCMTKDDTEKGGSRKAFWTDDSLVVSLLTMKRFCRPGEEPHTQIRVIKIEGSVEDHVDQHFNA
jgi:Holliday junction resolvase RusA-like endonuclease